MKLLKLLLILAPLFAYGAENSYKNRTNTIRLHRCYHAGCDFSSALLSYLLRHEQTKHAGVIQLNQHTKQNNQEIPQELLDLIPDELDDSNNLYENNMDIDLTVPKQKTFHINPLLRTSDYLRNCFIQYLLTSASQQDIKNIKISGNKEFLKYIKAFFKDFKDLYGNKEFGIPYILAWKWFGSKQPITLVNNGLIYLTEISYDDSFIVTCSLDKIDNILYKTVKIWNTKTGQLIHTLEKSHATNIKSIAISHDNTFIVTCSEEIAKIWDSKTGELIGTLEDPTNRISKVSISHDDSFIVISYYPDNIVKIWDNNTGKLIHTLEGHTDFINFITISHDNILIVTGSNDKTAKIWGSKTGELINTLEGHTSCIDSVAISRDNSFIVTTSNDKTAKIWNSKTGELITTLKSHTYNINSVSISHNDKFIVTGSTDETSKIWDSKTGELIKTLEGHTDIINSVAISHDNKFIVTGSNDNKAKLWDSKTGDLIHTLIGHTDPMISVAISHDDSFIVTCDNTVRIWHLNQD